MNITSTWVMGAASDVISSTVFGKTITVVLRRGGDLAAIGYLGNLDVSGDVNIVVVERPRDATRLVGKSLGEAKSGDILILLCPTEEAHKAALDVLGLDESGTAFDRQ